MFGALVREARRVGAAPRLRFGMAGGAASATELARAVEETFGCALRDGYGMSEVGGGITLDARRARRGRARSAPRCLAASCGSWISRRERRCRGRTRRGRGPKPQRDARISGTSEATRAVLDRDGWLSTGDVGYLDSDGYLFLVDRKKELIIRSGYNVYPREVEEVLSACPGVLEAAVVGVPDDEHGEEVVALVVPARLTRS